MERSRLTFSLKECRTRAARQPGTMLFESAQAFSLFQTAQASSNSLSYFFEHPTQWIEVHTLDQIPAAFAAIEQALTQGFWVAGYLSYECGYHWEPTAAPNFHPAHPLPLAALGVYHAPVMPIPSGEEETTCGLPDISLSLSPEAFQQQFTRIQQWIAEGDTYQVNLTCRVESAYSDSADVLFAHMLRQQPVPFGAMLNIDNQLILSASPELFFQLQGREILVRPMKGTAPRGRDQSDDDTFAAALASDEKNRAENVMIVDLLRSDIGRIAKIGSVRVEDMFKVERHPSLLQMTSTVKGTLREDVTLYKLFRAIFPSGSIVGAPKVRTMQLIRELEGRDRGVYTGAIGYITPERNAVFSVAIRTALLEHGRLSMGVGAGITAGSNAASEYEECLLKAAFLRDRSFELIESMRWEHGRCDLLDLHMQRLENSATYFGFTFDQQSTRTALANHASHLPADLPSKLRLAIHATGALTLTATRIQPDNSAILNVRLWPQPMQSADPWLRHKTTRRSIYEHALRVAQQAGCVDAIFLNEHAMVTEGAIHSILVCHGQTWRTPPLSAGVLPGVYRRHLLATRPEILEQDIHADELRTADHIYLMNSVRGLRRVHLQPVLLLDNLT